MKLIVDLHPVWELTPAGQRKGDFDKPQIDDIIYWCNDNEYFVENYRGTLAPIGMEYWGRIGDGRVEE